MCQHSRCRRCVHIVLYQMYCDPAMADITQSRRINLAYFHPMCNRDYAASLGGYQLPSDPTMKGRTSTDEYLCAKICRKGSYFSTLALAASSSTVGEPSKGQVTSTIMREDPSGEVIVRSGLFAPVVPGMACSFCFVPR